MKKELRISDVGYEKDFVDKNGNLIMLEFNLLDGYILIVKDFLDTKKYLSTEEFDSYQEKYSDEEGYGQFYEEYLESGEMWDVIAQEIDKNVLICEKAYELFDDSTIARIQGIYLGLIE